MSLTIEDLNSVTEVRLPAVYSWHESTPFGSLQRRSSPALSFAAKVKTLASSRNRITSLIATRESGEEFSVGTVMPTDFFAPAGQHFHATKFSVKDGVLWVEAGGGWVQHPQKVSDERSAALEQIRNSWEN